MPSLLFIVSFLASFQLTNLIRQHAHIFQLLDIPNHRSTHSEIMPRGGGLAFILVFLIGFIFVSNLPFNQVISVVLSGVLIAVVGLLDDRNHVPAGWRLVIHFSAVLLNLTAFGVLTHLNFFEQILAFFSLVWLLNLSNFMDGIDGLAGLETLSVCFANSLLCFLITDNAELRHEFLLLTGAMMGFLAWNLPPAKIFMGDTGSVFLGLLFSLFTIQLSQINALFLWCEMILLAVFIVDTTTTLTHRLYRRENVLQAHREHIYQKFADDCGQKWVLVVVMLINLFWLMPLALLVGFEKLDKTLGVFIAYAPLVGITIYYKLNED